MEHQEMAIATRIGFRFYPQDGADSDALLEKAKTVGFLDGIDKNPKNMALTEAIIQMAHSLHLQTRVQGGETLAQ
ncbi:hypothetical protein [Laspinema olomoucense]|uniref:hypothetical protein n=1 Tax=Laspinema olomoucense TaxID=3231600 RepID=UPI0021BA912E|nr:hypothetical protein [Laspinema sp. D3c]MCT7995829.1 hypothetical protein [Laspinema sp. D3c]